MPFCPDCGYKMLSSDKYCYNCGKNVIVIFSSLLEKPEVNPISRIVTDNKIPSVDVLPSIGKPVINKHEENVTYKTESEILNLPYSWIVNDIEITILDLVKVEDYERNNPLSNKKQYEVLIKFRNILKTSNQIKGNSLGFDSLKLRTDLGNTWDLKSNAENLVLTGTVDPEDQFVRNDSIFEIRKNELPEYLVAEIFGKKYYFAIKPESNRSYKVYPENYLQKDTFE